MILIASLLQGGPKKYFSSQSCVLQFFSIFFKWCWQQIWEILLSPIWVQLDYLQHRSTTKELKIIVEDPQNWFSRNASFLWETACWVSGGFLMVYSYILNILRIFAERWTMSAFVGICHTSCLPKFGHQTLNCPCIRYIVPAKIFPALPLCDKNWFCGKVHVDNFYPLLLSMASSWIHIGVKKSLPGLLSTPPEKYGKKNLKHNFQTKNKIECVFWTTLYFNNIVYSFIRDR